MKRYYSLSLYRIWKGILSAAIMTSVLAASAPCADNATPADKPADKPAQRMSLNDALGAALGINASIKQAEEGQKSALSRLRIANVDTSYGLGSSTSLQHNSSDSGVTGQMFSNATYEAITGTTASVNLAPYAIGSQRGSLAFELRRPFMSGSGLLSSKSDKILSAKSEASIEDRKLYLTRQSITLDVIQSYYSAVLAREMVKVKEHAVQIAEEAQYEAVEREKEGLVTGMDVSRAGIQVAATKNMLTAQQKSARETLDRLMLAIGKGVGDTPELTDPLPDSVPELPTLGKAVSTALDNRYDIKVSEAEIAESERKLKLKNDLFRPRLDAVMGFNSDEDGNGIIGQSLFRSGAFNAGLELVLPIDRRINTEEQQTAKRGLDVLRQLHDYQLEQVTEQVQNAYRRVESARASLDILNENYKIAQQNLDLNKEAMSEGIINNRDLLEAQDSLINVEGDLHSTKTELYLASLSLKYYMGEDLTDMGSK